MDKNIKTNKKLFKEITVKESKEINGGIGRRRLIYKSSKIKIGNYHPVAQT